ncbi:uncharacterized protein N7484_006432 [Penicillium longicatenatum]|uniref:uncharacterized protein n=1 Tax=Penicillium longicatenatum TaxID=1561947 RepID=UPI002548DC81|nr:uncharacterized protein N7484_006432 [Penicillium longicatenatum]KAJ5643925.1 hypothetical protein N7484_006432 [Penicillium longicatenatum]
MSSKPEHSDFPSIGDIGDRMIEDHQSSIGLLALYKGKLVLSVVFSTDTGGTAVNFRLAKSSGIRKPRKRLASRNLRAFCFQILQSPRCQFSCFETCPSIEIINDWKLSRQLGSRPSQPLGLKP